MNNRDKISYLPWKREQKSFFVFFKLNKIL